MDEEELKDYETDDDSLDEASGLRVKLDAFEGPLDLLLHLIKRAKIRIADIFISDITKQFLEYIEDIEQVDIDKASEFLGMAAYLLEIKAKALLPKPEVAQSEEEDDGSELIRRLEEYELYKKETEKLKDLETIGIHYREPDKTVGDERTVLKDMTMEGILEALRKLYERAEKRSLDIKTKEIVRDPFTVNEKIEHIRATLDEKYEVKFTDLFDEYATVNEVITTFQALLELMKLQFLTAQQTETFGDISLVKLSAEE
ncbi:MAG: segregation/condensation protein A [Clostridia bacterium]|nr:segregation/condensation protein A [Clostridia bacterium]